MPSQPPIPCPPGYVWDGKRFFRLPPNLAKVTDAAEAHQGSSASASRNDGQKEAGSSRQHHKKKKKGKRSRDGAGKETQNAVPNEDRPPVASSSFAFTPARPPAYFHGTRDCARALPRDLPPSLATSNRWKKMRIRDHANALTFFSRDTLSPKEGGNRSAQPPESTSHRIERMQGREQAGSLLWLATRQGRRLYRSRSDDTDWVPISEAAMPIVDMAGRQPGGSRFMHPGGVCWRNTGPELLLLSEEIEGDVSQADIDRARARQYANFSNRRGYPRSMITTAVFDVTMAFNADDDPPMIRHCTRYSIRRHQVLYTHAIEVDEPRDITSQGHLRLEEWEGRLDQYVAPPPCLHMAVPLNFEWQLGVASAPHPVAAKVTAPPYKNILTIRVSTDDRGSYLSSIEPDLRGGSQEIYSFPRQEKPYSAAAMAQGSGYCWVGYHSGAIRFIDSAAWANAERQVHRRADGRPGQTWHGKASVTDRYRSRGAVTNLLPLAWDEVIAVFSGGSILRLRVHSIDDIRTAAEYRCHVNEGTTEVQACLHPASRLLAVRGTDATIRIWHLDEEYPLNSLWHEPRNTAQGERVLIVPSPTLSERLLARRTETTTTTACRDSQEDFVALATRHLEEGPKHEFMRSPLAQQKVSADAMAFVPTSWASNRDGQWELTRHIDELGQAQVVCTGVLPSLAIAVNTEPSANILYFEPYRRPGVG
ncbi:unnamed protein product [Parajaminaea phylloscopi]